MTRGRLEMEAFRHFSVTHTTWPQGPLRGSPSVFCHGRRYHRMWFLFNVARFVHGGDGRANRWAIDMLRRFFCLFAPSKGTENPYQSPSPDLDLDLRITQEQIDAAQVVQLDVPEFGCVEIQLVPQIEDGFVIRLPELLPNKGVVVAHIHVVPS